ncbi:porin family protein [Formosa sp. A9]|uniref:porin family protein n=1 Tax=Formosa sp. A9 TaxID=3442641 RepID=UPI003EB9639E
MKKLLFFAAFTVAGLMSMNAQNTTFGITAGYTNIKAKTSYEGQSYSESISGFHVGALVDFGLNENFHIQPEVIYANAEEMNFLYIPVLAKYYISNSGFQLLAGPQVNIVLDELIDGLNNVGLDLTFGAAYDINEHFFIDARYSFELTNRFEDGADYDVSGKYNTLFAGVGYKF